MDRTARMVNNITCTSNSVIMIWNTLGSKRNYLSNGLLIGCSGICFAYVSYRPLSHNITAILAGLIAIGWTSIWINSNESLKEYDRNSLGRYGLIVGTAGFAALSLQAPNMMKLSRIYNSEGIGRILLQGNEICKEGDRSIKEFLETSNIQGVKDLGAGENIILIDGQGFSTDLGVCHIRQDNNETYYPFVLQPMMLYLDPLNKEKSKEIASKIFKERGIKTVHIVVNDKRENHKLEELLQKRLSTLLGNETKQIDAEFKGKNYIIKSYKIN